MWSFEENMWRNGFKHVAGIDEAGRGPLAGPVVSASVILHPGFPATGIDDSKKVSPKNRALLYEHIYQHAVSIGIGIVDPTEIDRINILQASLLSMMLSVKNLNPQPDVLLIDGKFTIKAEIPQKAIVKGDCLSVSIAAASIIAKVTRDRLMERYDQEYPQFGFAKHKGYPTKAHCEAIQSFGPSPIHRRSFRGVKEC